MNTTEAQYFQLANRLLLKELAGHKFKPWEKRKLQDEIYMAYLALQEEKLKFFRRLLETRKTAKIAWNLNYESRRTKD